MFHISSEWIYPAISTNVFLSDPFGRFEARVAISVDDEGNALGITETCSSCFVWQLKGNQEWMDIDHHNNGDISVTAQQSQSEDGEHVLIVTVTIQSVRRQHSGYCVPADIMQTHLFQPDQQYQLRLLVTTPGDHDYRRDGVFRSDELEINTDVLPSNGDCSVEDIQDVFPLQPFNVLCRDCETSMQHTLEYNALIGDVLMSKYEFVSDSRDLSAIAPVGNLSISVLIRNENTEKGITCMDITPQFRSIQDVLRENDRTC